MKIARAILFSLVLSLLASPAHAQNKPAPQDALLYFVWPQNGAVIKGGFWCRFCLFAEAKAIVVASVFVFALSVSSALFLIVDLSHPFEGLMQISDHHLRVVLPELDK